MAKILVCSSFFNSKELNIFAANIKIIKMSSELVKLQIELNREFDLEEKNYIAMYSGLDAFEPHIKDGKLRYKKRV